MLVKVSAKGQITLPKNIRQNLNIKPGDSVAITQRDDELVLTPITKTLFDMRGIIPVSGPLDFDALIEQAKRVVAEDVIAGMSNE